MITAVIGHRGVGKSELIHRLTLHFSERPVHFLDLDIEIEKKAGKSIPEIFRDHGEGHFRELEKHFFLEIIENPHDELFLILGAGFDVQIIPESVHVLWVKRKTDFEGRIFLNRPRLDPQISPLQEYQMRAKIREPKFQARADEIYLMPEGPLQNHHQAMAVEKNIFGQSFANVQGSLTVAADIFSSPQRHSQFIKKYAGKGLSFFELRDDLLSWLQITQLITEMPQEKFVYSFRRTQDLDVFWKTATEFKLFEKVQWVDWAWELGTPQKLLKYLAGDKIILSLHDSAKMSDWAQYETQVGHLKYAPEVLNFSDLESGHIWQQNKPQGRSFLPRSNNGRWEWYRLYQKGKQFIHFWREGEGSAADQPSLFWWLMTPNKFATFAAVLGDPVFHSFTPLEHSDYFHKFGMPVFAITISRQEWPVALPFLQSLGLSHAAVTSPHKENAAALCGHSEIKAVNTLWWDKKSQAYKGTSTDEQGFVAPLQQKIAVWGGGGVLEMIRKSLPQAQYFSARTGLSRDSSGNESFIPEVVVWAAPRMEETLMPPKHWQPKCVYDLNYKEDSLGREYALACQAEYQSGLAMFLAQAQGQRVFWSQCQENL